MKPNRSIRSLFLITTCIISIFGMGGLGKKKIQRGNVVLREDITLKGSKSSKPRLIEFRLFSNNNGCAVKVTAKSKCVARVVAAFPWQPKNLCSPFGTYRIKLTLEDPTVRIHALLYGEDGARHFSN